MQDLNRIKGGHSAQVVSKQTETPSSTVTAFYHVRSRPPNPLEELYVLRFRALTSFINLIPPAVPDNAAFDQTMFPKSLAFVRRPISFPLMFY